MRNFLLFLLFFIFIMQAPICVKGKSANEEYPVPFLYLPGQQYDDDAFFLSPPKFDSHTFMEDQALYKLGKELRNTERGLQAAEDAKYGKTLDVFLEAFGYPISEEKTPELYNLIRRTYADLCYVGEPAKKHFKRIRPFVMYSESTCYPPDEEELRASGSFPSSHSAIGWGLALLLTELNPERSEPILKRGYDYGQSRVICGYHWQSDVDSGRLFGAAAIANLHANPEFQAQFEKAKQEFKILKAREKAAQ